MANDTLSTPSVDRGNLALPLACLLILLVAAVPSFLRMPLTNDAEMYDLQADLVRRGGVLYRDALEPNLPGIVWVHVAVRTLFGESSEALKFFDLAVFAGIAGFAAGLVRLVGGSGRAAAWTAFALAGFYLSQSEWIHCQRDVWMLLPALAAITCRIHVRHREQSLSSTNQFLGALLEGALWGCAVWLKPYVVFPAAAVWGTSQLIALTNSRATTPRLVPSPLSEGERTRPGATLSQILVELAGLLGGGGAIGAAGIGWMLYSGCWPYFLETALHWNGEYFSAGREHWTLSRFVPMVLRFFPWYGLHLFAVPLAIRALTPAPTSGDRTARATAALVAAAYCGWLLQAFAFQHLFDYIHAPTVVLAILLVALKTMSAPVAVPVHRGAWLAFAAIAIFMSPCVQPSRLNLWPVCVRGPITPAVRDRLSHFFNPNRKDLERVATFLRRQNVGDRDVCFYNSDLVGLYRQMGLLPPTRYAYFYETIRFLPSHRGEVLNELSTAPHRYVVTDVLTTGIAAEKMDRLGPNGPLEDAKAQPKGWTRGYPWSQPAVFRAGTYLVHRVDGPIDALSVPIAPPKRDANTKTAAASSSR